MNRAERRKQGIKQPPPRMKHLTEDAYKRAIDQAYRKGTDVGFEQACNYAVVYMLAVPLLVLNESFNEVRLKEFDGKSRVAHFFDLCTEMYERYNSGPAVLEKLFNDVYEKTGFNISEQVLDKDKELNEG